MAKRAYILSDVLLICDLLGFGYQSRQRATHLVILVATSVILSHSPDEIEDRYKGADSIVVAA
jgi:hypothetical protein